MATKITETARQKYFGGYQCTYEHYSEELKCKMNFAVYFPPSYSSEADKSPVLLFLSGLTCTHENFTIKSGMQRLAAQHGFLVISPDTSPRGSNHPGEHDDWGFGSGAGFYLDATNAPWDSNYRMYSYVTRELLDTAFENFHINRERMVLSGHSMGGHGSLVIYLRNPGLFRAATALAPISNPTQGLWGVKAFTNYLGEDKSKWAEWDATEIVKKFTSSDPVNLLVCQGEKDKFYEKELFTENFVEAARGNPSVNVEYRVREGYDHFYPYISTFLNEHFEFLAKFI
jgi:S-formylglutathione hydrolase